MTAESETAIGWSDVEQYESPVIKATFPCLLKTPTGEELHGKIKKLSPSEGTTGRFEVSIPILGSRSSEKAAELHNKEQFAISEVTVDGLNKIGAKLKIKSDPSSDVRLKDLKIACCVGHKMGTHTIEFAAFTIYNYLHTKMTIEEFVKLVENGTGLKLTPYAPDAIPTP